MSKKLAGTLFVRNGIEHDYCFVEAIKCLLEFCDHVFVVDAGSDDGTLEEIIRIKGSEIDKYKLISLGVGSASNHFFKSSIDDKNIKRTTYSTWSSNKITIISFDKDEWENHKGKEKLSYFTNVAINAAKEAGYEYQFNLQADEIVHEKSYSEIRNCLNDNDEGYMCKRINLWSSPYMQLDVPLNRMPCSTSIVRLAKTNYLSYDDAENVGVPLVNTYFEGGIRIYHMGFVRRREVMKSKIINMQCNVFGMEHYDAKLDQAEIFNPDLWFHPQNDLRPIDEPLPKLIQEWAKERVVFN